jgi:hypothetical protein
MPRKLAAISGSMLPWFHANVKLLGGGMKMHGDAQFAAAAKKK